MKGFTSEYALFLGREEEGLYTGFYANDTFYLVVEIKDSVSKEEGRAVVETIKESITSENPITLSHFTSVIDGALKKHRDRSLISLSAGLLVDDVVYLKTHGEGEVHVKRRDEFAKIIDGERDASGLVKDSDHLVLTTSDFSSRIDMAYLKSQMKGSPKAVVEQVTPRLKEREDAGSIALFVQFKMHEEEARLPEEEDELEVQESERGEERASLLFRLKQHLAYFRRQSSHGRKLTLVAVVVLFIVLAWSVVFGVQRRAHGELVKKVDAYEERINKRLDEAADISVLNLDRSLVLIKEAKSELKSLKELVGDGEFEEVGALEEKIKKTEQAVTKKEDKSAEEFYDLTLIDKNASALAMYKDQDNVVLLDRDGGRIYVLSLSKKSTKTVKDTAIKDAQMVALYNDEVFFASQKAGIYKADSEGKVTRAVEADSKWGALVDFWIYNGNLYLLDRDKDEIYKYLVAQEGYSAKTSYIAEGQAVDLARASALAIDASVYVSVGNTAFKYVAGERDAFELSIPGGGDVSLDEIFTDADTSKLYLLDRTRGAVYVASKDGQYEKQITSSIFKKADDFVVWEEDEKILVLVGSKIYSVSLE